MFIRRIIQYVNPNMINISIKIQNQSGNLCQYWNLHPFIVAADEYFSAVFTGFEYHYFLLRQENTWRMICQRNIKHKFSFHAVYFIIADPISMVFVGSKWCVIFIPLWLMAFDFALDWIQKKFYYMYIAPILKGCKVKIARRLNKRSIFCVYILEDMKLAVLFIILIWYYNLSIIECRILWIKLYISHKSLTSHIYPLKK